MRMGPFSNPEVIEILNRYFVPILASTEDYVKPSTTSKQERQLLKRIWSDAARRELPSGVVHVFVVNAQGEVYDSQHVRDAARTPGLLRFLRNAIEDLDPVAGQPLFPSAAVGVTGQEPPGRSLSLRVAAEYTKVAGSLVEATVVLDEKEWRSLLPPDQDAMAWAIKKRVARKLLVNLCPMSQDWDVRRNRILRCSLQANRITGEHGEPHVALRGELVMLHNRYTNRQPERVTAELVGLVLNRNAGPPEIKLTTGQATYGGRAFDGLISNVP